MSNIRKLDACTIGSFAFDNINLPHHLINMAPRRVSNNGFLVFVLRLVVAHTHTSSIFAIEKRLSLSQ